MKTSLTIIGLLIAGSAIAGQFPLMLDPGFSPGFRMTVTAAAQQNGLGPGGGAIPFRGPGIFVTINPATGIKTTNMMTTPFQNFPNKP